MSGNNSPPRPSASRSRVRPFRSASPPLLPAGPDSLVFQEGGIDEETAELIHEFVHPHHREAEETLVEVDQDATPDEEADQSAMEEERAERSKRPWWRRPSPWWYIALIPFSMAASISTMAPRLEVFTDLICDVQRHSPTDWDPEGMPPSALSRLGALPFSLSSPRDMNIPLAYGTGVTPLDSDILSGNSSTGHISRPDSPVPCASDPKVQAAVAMLLTIMATSQGLLGVVTTAFWSAMSDRHGRIFMLSINVSGLLIMDAIILAVILFPRHVPGGYWALVYAGLFEGILGGRSASIAAIHAYLADCSDSSTRSRTFSLFLGLLFTGMAVGPTMASLVIHLTGNVMNIFYIAIAVHFVFAMFTWFVVPESVLPTQMKISRAKYAAESLLKRQGRGAMAWLKAFFGFLSPLSIFSPLRSENGANPLKARRRDWSLTWLAASYGPDTLIIGSGQYAFQYAAGAFGWNSEKIGYWLSLVAVTRALYLAVGLPVMLNYMRGKPAIQLPISPSEPLNARAPSRSPSANLRVPSHPSPSRAPSHAPSHRVLAARHTPAIDLSVARGSLFIQVLSFALMAGSPTAYGFVAGSVLASLAAGFSPTAHSLALELYTQRGGTESGKLFGALSVLQALGSQIVGPSLYGFVYIKTVATLPQAIFYTSLAVVLLSFGFISLVRLRKTHDVALEDVEGEVVSGQREREETLIEAVPVIVIEEAPDEHVRGRRLSKGVSAEA